MSVTDNTLTLSLADITSVSDRQSVSDSDSGTVYSSLAGTVPSAAVALNASFQGQCTQIRFSDMDFLPWDNPDNIVNAQVERIAYTVRNNVLVFLFLIGGPANVINMAVFYKQGLKDRVNLCLFALSFTDELYLLACTVMHGEQLHLQFTTPERYGPIEIFMVNENLTFLTGLYCVSPVISAIIALERCYCVLRPLKIQTLMRTRTMAAVITAVYVVVLTATFIIVFRYRIGCVYDPDSRVVLTTFVVGKFYTDHKELIDLLESLMFVFGLPGVVMMTVITSTIITIVKLRQIVTWRAGTMTSSLSAKEVALTRMLVGSSILFIACVSPVALIRFSWLLFPEVNAGRRHHNIYLVSVWLIEVLAFMNASFNVFVYYAMGSRYRETLRSLCRRHGSPEAPTALTALSSTHKSV